MTLLTEEWLEKKTEKERERNNGPKNDSENWHLMMFSLKMGKKKIALNKNYEVTHYDLFISIVIE